MKTLNSDLSQIMKSLADETNLRLLGLIKLHGELCVCEFEDMLELPQPTVSRHLKALAYSRLIQMRKDCKWRYYSMADCPEFVDEIVNIAVEHFGIKKRECPKKCGEK
ncbi:MAG: winged helix-turn-helix transcriptional regulator [Kosmotogaceae bacterium]|nr:winged helix-turn-helix transcriptional regulator [Kosmotogaceae bacterium]